MVVEDGDIICATSGAPRGWSHPPEVNSLEPTSAVRHGVASPFGCPMSLKQVKRDLPVRSSQDDSSTIINKLPKRNMSILALMSGEFFAILRVSFSDFSCSGSSPLRLPYLNSCTHCCLILKHQEDETGMSSSPSAPSLPLETIPLTLSQLVGPTVLAVVLRC